MKNIYAGLEIIYRLVLFFKTSTVNFINHSFPFREGSTFLSIYKKAILAGTWEITFTQNPNK